MIWRLLVHWIIVLIISTSFAIAQTQTGYKQGMVVCAYPEAAQVGLDILKKGGNAVDAAVAVHFALAATLPQAGNIGGGGFMVLRLANGSSTTLDFREKAPIRATTNMYLDPAGNPIPDKSLYTHQAVGVPGSVDGMATAHQKYGNLKWSEVINPAIQLAEKGFKISEHLAADLRREQTSFTQLNPGKTYFLKADWQKGDLLVQTDLAKTLKRIRDNGRAGFYSGKVAKLLVHEMRRNGGLISENDLKSYQSIWRTPLIGQYKDYGIITMPPPSSGGIALLQLLKMVEQYPLSRWGFQADSTVQLTVEAERRVYADRAEYLGDPDFFKVPTYSLLQAKYIISRISNFSWDKATPSTEIKAGVLQEYESDETTHFSIVDKQGNAVAVTTTLNGSFGSKIFVRGAGFLLNNEMDDFSIKPGSPNMYSLIGGQANAILPGKRMLSSMTPTILTKNNKLFMVVGTPGGSTIITSVFQTILNVIEFKQNIAQSVTSKRFHHQWKPDVIFAEKNAINTPTRNALQKKGYVFEDKTAIGRVDAIVVDSAGYLHGGADPRGDDTVAAW